MAQHVGVLPSAARTATVVTPDFRNDNGVGLFLVIDVTSVTATPSITVKIEGKDPTSGKYYDILVAGAITGAGTTVLRVHPDLTASANLIAKDLLPTYWRVTSTHGDADSITYSVGASIV